MSISGKHSGKKKCNKIPIFIDGVLGEQKVCEILVNTKPCITLFYSCHEMIDIDHEVRSAVVPVCMKF